MSNRDDKDAPTMPTVKFDPVLVTETVKADLHDNIQSLRDIEPSDISALYDAALSAISAGGDLYSLSKFLGTLGVDVRRAAKISRYLWSNAKALIEAERLEALGIEFSIWMYSGAPCGDAEQDSAHRAANGKRYPVSEGLCLNGRFTLPGREFGCKCSSRPFIPGFEE